VHGEVGLDGNVYIAQAQAASLSSSFESVLSIHCLAALDLVTDVEQPFDCLIIQNRQAVQSMRRSMDWTLEDNVFNGLIFFEALASCKSAIPHLYNQERKRLTPVRWRLSRNHAVLGRAIPGGWVGNGNTGSCSALQPFRIPSVIHPERCTSVTVVRRTDELLCSG